MSTRVGKPAALIVSSAVLAMCMPILADKSTDADLTTDQRVAKLEKKLNQQSRQLRKLKRSYNTLVKSEKATGLQTKLSMHGWISQALMLADDQHEDQLLVTTNSNASSRLMIDGEVQPNNMPAVTMGSHLQLRFDVNPSSSVSQSTPNPSDTLDMRVIELYVKHNKLGTMTFGKGGAASNGMMDVDYSNTKVIAGSDMMDIGGGLFFRTPGAVAYASNPTVSTVINNFDGFGFTNRLRYDSPTWHEMSVSASQSEDEKSDVQLQYAHKLKGAKFGAALGVTSPQASNDARGEVIGGSASMLWDNGLSVSTSVGALRAGEEGRHNPGFVYVKVGYQTELNSYGNTAFAVDIGRFNHVTQNNDEAQGYGAYAVQTFDALHSDVFAGYRHFSLERVGSSFDSLNVLVAGMKFSF